MGSFIRNFCVIKLYTDILEKAAQERETLPICHALPV
jgi:hypothetical protein